MSESQSGKGTSNKGVESTPCKPGSLINKSNLNLTVLPSPSVHSLSNHTVLDEDVYTAAIDHIIQRDFFPDLKRFKEYERELIATPGNIQENVEEIDLENSLAAPGLNLGLDKFLANFTSEDNHSFQTILTKNNHQLKEKYPWLYGSDAKLIAPPESSVASSSLILIKSAEQEDKERRELKESTDLNSFKDDDKLEQRFAKPVGTWKFQPKNTLMYQPGGHTLTKLSERYLRGQPKEIMYHNTRVPNQLHTTAPSTPTTATSGITQIDSTKNYDLVEATPKPDPTALGDNNPMTWGFIDSTPIRLNESGTPARQYKLPEPKYRDLLGQKLSNQARQSIRKRQQINTPSKSPYPGAGTPGRLNLTPAGRRLLESTHRSNKLINPGDSMLREAYSLRGGTPKTKRGTPSTYKPTPKPNP